MPDGGGPLSPALIEVWREFRAKVFDDVEVLAELAMQLLLGEQPDDDTVDARARTAHQLAGIFGTFGAPEGTDAARRFEDLLRARMWSGDGVRQVSDLVVELQAAVAKADRLCSEAPVAASPTDRDTARESDGGPPGAPATDVAKHHVAARPLVLLVGVARAAEVGAALAAVGAEARAATSTTAALVTMAKEPVAVVVLSLAEHPIESARPLLFAAGSNEPRGMVIGIGDAETTMERVELVRAGVRQLLPGHATPGEITGAVTAALTQILRPEPVVLVVDDDRVLTATIETCLTSEAMRVETLSEPEQFWSVLENVQPDLVILDVDMPGITGLELCAALRADARQARLPVLFVSANGSDDIVRRMFDVGADDHVVKPFAKEVLVARVERQLRRAAAVSGSDAHGGLSSRITTEAVASRLGVLASTGQTVAVAVIVDDGLDVPERAAQVAALARRTAGDAGVACRWNRSAVVAVFPTNDLAGSAAELAAASRPLNVRSGIHSLERGRALADHVSAIEATVVAGDTALVSDAGGPSTQVDVVIVEDDPMIADLVVRGLQGRGISATAISDGLEAVSALAGRSPSLHPRVIVLDVDLPGLSGTDVLRRLAVDGVLGRASVVMLTARAGETEVLESLRLGAVDHVAKPFSVPILVQRIRQALGTA